MSVGLYIELRNNIKTKLSLKRIFRRYIISNFCHISQGHCAKSIFTFDITSYLCHTVQRNGVMNAYGDVY